MDEDLEISLKKFCSEDRMEYFVKSKMIQVNLKGNTICHADSFWYEDSLLIRQKKDTHYLLPVEPEVNVKAEFAICRFNYEYIKSTKYLCIEKQKLETVFNKAFENKIPSNEDEGLGEHPLIKNLENNVTFLKYERLLSSNVKIMKNKELIKKMKENKIKVNLPVMYNQINEDNSDYIGILSELMNTIDSLKKTVDVTIKPTMTNITINNTMSNADVDINNTNEINVKSKKGTSSSFKINKSIVEEDLDPEADVKSKIQNLEEHLTQFKDDEEKNRKLLEQNLLDIFSKEVSSLKLKLEETQKENSASSKDNKSARLIEMHDLLNQVQEVSQEASQNYVDRRLVASHITKILYKSTSSKIKLELLESLSILLQLDNQDRKLVGLSVLSKESINQSSIPYTPYKEIYEKIRVALSIFKSNINLK